MNEYDFDPSENIGNDRVCIFKRCPCLQYNTCVSCVLILPFHKTEYKKWTPIQHNFKNNNLSQHDNKL